MLYIIGSPNVINPTSLPSLTSDTISDETSFHTWIFSKLSLLIGKCLDFISKSSGKYFFTIDKAKLSPPFLASGVYNTSIFFSVSTAFTVNKELSPGPVPIP